FFVESDPAGDAFAETERSVGAIDGSAGESLDFEVISVGVDEGDGAAGCAGEANRFVENLRESFLRIIGAAGQAAYAVKRFGQHTSFRGGTGSGSGLRSGENFAESGIQFLEIGFGAEFALKDGGLDVKRVDGDAAF